MENTNYLAILTQGVEAWNRWRKENMGDSPDLQEVDLSGANLEGASFEGVNLSRANFKRANLAGVSFMEANLLEADFREADLRKATLERTYLEGIYLRGAYFEDTDFSGATLSGTDLSEINFTGANLSGANLSRANLWGANLSGISLVGADLRGADLAGANLSGADLSEANLSEANLEEVNLTQANLEKADLIQAKLLSANLQGANLTQAYLRNIELLEANLRGANLREVNLMDADLSRANLREVNLMDAILAGAELLQAKLSAANLKRAYFWKADLSEANLEAANLVGADLVGVDLTGANLVGANLVGADLTGANLVGANLVGADLTGANLIMANVIRANLETATLTGACLENWNVNSQTNLNNVNCQYIYLKTDAKRNFQDRRPHHPEKSFAPGEFTKLFQVVTETMDLVFMDGIDWSAFLKAFEQLRQEIQTDELSIQAIESKPSGVLIVRVAVPSTADKAQLEKHAYQKYQLALESQERWYREKLNAKDGEIEIYRRQNANLNEIAKLQASRPIQLQATAMTSGDTYNQNQVGIGHMSGSKIEGEAKVAGVLNQAGQQSLAEAAAEIQQLLEQLDETYATDTASGKWDAAQAVMKQIENDKSLADRILSALRAGGTKALEKTLNHPAATFVIEMITDWQKTKS
ncbi:pentapeptide repeat-containing protein [Baaleninema simplex]|uniref:pentapeptide repeat-containing protein n=1 Tax=Baaleninema simplex TaxID=2862350 RepID=UPI00036B9B30|nr:pentapeptide repeat-containing protein [Baaleninema simplex]